MAHPSSLFAISVTILYLIVHALRKQNCQSRAMQNTGCVLNSPSALQPVLSSWTDQLDASFLRRTTTVMRNRGLVSNRPQLHLNGLQSPNGCFPSRTRSFHKHIQFTYAVVWEIHIKPAPTNIPPIRAVIRGPILSWHFPATIMENANTRQHVA